MEKLQQSSTSKMSTRAADTHLLIFLLLCHLGRLILLLSLLAALLQLLLILLDDRFFLLGELFSFLLLGFGFLIDDRTCEATICQMRWTRIEEVLLAPSECGRDEIFTERELIRSKEFSPTVGSRMSICNGLAYLIVG